MFLPLLVQKIVSTRTFIFLIRHLQKMMITSQNRAWIYSFCPAGQEHRIQFKMACRKEKTFRWSTSRDECFNINIAHAFASDKLLCCLINCLQFKHFRAFEILKKKNRFVANGHCMWATSQAMKHTVCLKHKRGHLGIRVSPSIQFYF